MANSALLYADFTAEQCLALTPADAQVACELRHLDAAAAPSIWDAQHYPQLWEPVACLLYNVTLSNQVTPLEAYNQCTIPLRGADAFLFASLALAAAAALFGRLAAVWTLVAGGALGALNHYVNLRHLSSGVALWLAITPADLFFYAFLPPLLVEQALRVDFFMFRRLWAHALLMAFAMVMLSVLAISPFILFVLGFQARGWSWAHGALFAAVVAPTDALAVGAILAKANGPHRLQAIMEGESLFNDASALTLFEIFLHIIEEHAGDIPPDWPSVWSVLPSIIVEMITLTAVGAAIGAAFALATGLVLRMLRWRGAAPTVEAVFVVATAYMTYYVTQATAGGSGVVAVVVLGLWGNATSRWGALAEPAAAAAFDAVWDALSFAANGLVFFWSGVSAVSYFLRALSVEGMRHGGWAYGAIPLLYLFIMALRVACIALFNVTAFRWLGEALDWREILFVGWAGLRGGVSLIMVSLFASQARSLYGRAYSPVEQTVDAEISLWTACLVLMTLAINGPLIGPVLRLLRLNAVPPEKLRMRGKARRALARFAAEQLDALRADEDEMLAGADWGAVAAYADVGPALEGADAAAAGKGKGKGKGRKAGAAEQAAEGELRGAWRRATRCCRRGRSPARAAAPKDGGSRDVSTNGAANGGAANGGSSAGGTPRSPSPALRDGAWSDASDEELVATATDEVPFLPPGASAARGSGACAPAGGSGLTPGGGSAPAGAPDVETGLGAIAEAPAASRRVSGAVGAALAAELRRSLSEAPGADFLAAAHASMPAGRGRSMQAELARELAAAAAADAPGAPSPFLAAAAAPGGAPGLQPGAEYYASVPTLAGRAMRQELQAELARAADAGAAAPAAPQALTAPPPPLPAGLPPRPPPLVLPCSTMSVPAATGRAMQLQLTEALRRPSAASAAPPLELNSMSLPAAAGRAMQADLVRRLADGERGSLAAPPPAARSTDLLGRKLSARRRPGSGQLELGALAPLPAPAVKMPLYHRTTSMAAALLDQRQRSHMHALAPHRVAFDAAAAASLSPAPHGPPRRFLSAPPARAPTPDSARFLPASPALGGDGASGAALLARTFSVGAALHAGGGPGAPGGGADGEDGEGEDEDGATAAVLAEARVRLVAGLRRYYAGKRAAGLLSARGLRTLQHACDRAEHGGGRAPLALWEVLRADVGGGWGTRLAARLLRSSTVGYARLPAWLRRPLSAPFRAATGGLRRRLGRRMLVACEVAVEFFLSLSWSPQVRVLRVGDPGARWRLLAEVEAQAAAAHDFVIAREVEAPDRFQAIQSYRAAVALLRRQALFVAELFEAGVVDAAERGVMAEPLERRLRRLELVGPVWRPPRPKAVLRGVPALAALPADAFRRLASEAALREAAAGEVVWAAGDAVRASGGAAGPGVFVVASGVLRRTLTQPDGAVRAVHVGAGGVVGTLLALTGARLPGEEAAVAEGNALGKGPSVLHFAQPVLARLVAAGERVGAEPHARRLVDDLLRSAAGYALEFLDHELEAEAAAALAAGALAGVGSMSELASPAPGLDARGSVASLAALASAVPGSANLAAMIHQDVAALEFDEDGAAAAGGSGAASQSVSPIARAPPPPPAGWAPAAPARRSTAAATGAKARAALARQYATAAASDARHALSAAIVLRLPPAATFEQTTPAVLLGGALEARHGATHAPRLLLWPAGAPCAMPAEAHEGPRCWRVGPQGATLVVCRGADGVPPIAPTAAEELRARWAAACLFPAAPQEDEGSGRGRGRFAWQASRLRRVSASGRGFGFAPDLGGGPPSNSGSEPNSLSSSAAVVLGRSLRAMLSRRPPPSPPPT